VVLVLWFQTGCPEIRDGLFVYISTLPQMSTCGIWLKQRVKNEGFYCCFGDNFVLILIVKSVFRHKMDAGFSFLMEKFPKKRPKFS